MLAAVPDLRPSLKNAGLEDLAALFEAFDVIPVDDELAARWSSARP